MLISLLSGPAVVDLIYHFYWEKCCEKKCRWLSSSGQVLFSWLLFCRLFKVSFVQSKYSLRNDLLFFGTGINSTRINAIVTSNSTAYNCTLAASISDAASCPSFAELLDFIPSDTEELSIAIKGQLKVTNTSSFPPLPAISINGSDGATIICQGQ